MTDQQRDFIDQLRKLGYEPEIVNNHVVFDFTVQTGPCDGETIRVGVDVPRNWPASAPHWVHVSPPMTDGGNVHQSEIGSDWRKWSRPYQDQAWRRSDRTVRTYIGHIHRVFEHVRFEEDAVA